MAKKILLVDDEPDFIDLIKIRFEAGGYDVVTAYNGDEAIAKVESEHPTAVLLDILMPGMDGLSVLEHLRDNDKTLPIFIVTAFSNKERFEMAHKLGATGFIVKTDDLKDEVERIMTLIGGSSVKKIR